MRHSYYYKINNKMKQHFIRIASMLFCLAGLMLTGCVQKEAFPDVDGLDPVIKLDPEQEHIHTAAGYDAVIAGHLEDADGIASVRLVCPELFLDKTIDLIEIYGEPVNSYDLNYKYAIKRDELAEKFSVKVIVTDVGGRISECTIPISLDKDFESPVFALSVDKKLSVLKKSETKFELKFKITDNMGLESVVVNLEGVEGFENKTIDLTGKMEYEFSEVVVLPSELKDYNLTIVARDAQDNMTEIKSIVSVSEMPDFEKMYLADVNTAEELNSDIFGVPMFVEHSYDEEWNYIPYTFTAYYYCAVPNTEIRFIPQKTDFSPICFGLSKEDHTKLAEGYEDTDPIVLPNAGVYYQIDFNVLEETISISEYSIADAIDPVPHEFGSKSLDLWGDGSEFDDFYFGITENGPSDINYPFTQDKTNPHLYESGEIELAVGQDFNFIIHNYHKDGWWNYCTWRSDTAEDPEIFGYYGDVVNPKWKELNGDNWVGDNWTYFVSPQAGTYKMIFDAHLGRGKFIPVK